MKQKEWPGQALHRVCKWHVKKALNSLGDKSDPLEAIHDVRKEIKKMRALFRLSQTYLSRKDYRKTAKAMRLAAKSLAEARDARAMKRAFERVAGRHINEYPHFQRVLQAYCERAERHFTENDFGLIAKFILKKVDDQICDLELAEADWKEVQECLQNCYARGRDAYECLHTEPTPENFHVWRKKVKDLWYQMDFLCPSRPPKTKKLLRDLEILGEQLGDDHDLTLVEQFAQEYCKKESETAALRRLIEAKRRRYRERAEQLGARLYTEIAEDACNRLEGHWNAQGKRALN